ncbi:hypothetical protein CCMSSC00406_0008833 [Pleurotus cornucopiae]|uniref:Uncharacterized protein n=1 Tax=Pleurotus cornucopiae TaxID=5321 RepID=A0ACB7IJL9_PLECO|nr:hypothetical protein CCMSSC00406_0008833 [Pleurotus cornucopiae]
MSTTTFTFTALRRTDIGIRSSKLEQARNARTPTTPGPSDAQIRSAYTCYTQTTNSPTPALADSIEAAKHLNPCVLELGRKAPVVVLSDPNISHPGQACMSAERDVVHHDVDGLMGRSNAFAGIKAGICRGCVRTRTLPSLGFGVVQPAGKVEIGGALGVSTGDEEQKPLTDRELPPLDVALALHSLMLSPRRYFEDSVVRFKQLKRVSEYPLSMILAALDVNKMGYNEGKCHSAAEYWRTRTGFAFDAIESMRVDTETDDIMWNGDRGFAQANFEHKCPKCHELFTHDTLRAGKFLQAVNQAKEDRGYCLPNTSIILGAHLDVQARCPAIVDEVWGCFENGDGQLHSLKDVAMLAATERGDMMTYIAKRLSLPDSALRPESIPLLLRAFEHSYPFTQDVVTALHHQRWFIQDVYRQGWTGFDPGGPSDKDLDTAYDQYNDFLERSITVERRDPEWKDDLIWHTHQLMPDRYRADVASYIQVFLDHLPRGEGSDGYGEDIIIVTHDFGCEYLHRSSA